MGKRDNEYQLSGQMELDNALITTLINDDQKSDDLKRGEGSQNKSKVLVMTESVMVENPKPGKKPKKINHIKMQVIPDLKAHTAMEIVKEQIDSKAELMTDDSKTYYKLKQAVESHIAQVIKPEDIQKIFPWVHISIANIKRLLLDMHHQLKKEYLQYYFKEFSYKFKRCYFGEKMFDRLFFAAAKYNTDFKSRIYNRSLCG